MRRKRGTLRWIVTIAAAGSVGLLVFSCLSLMVVGTAAPAGKRQLHLAWSRGQIGVSGSINGEPSSAEFHFYWEPRRPELTQMKCRAGAGHFIVEFPAAWLVLPLTLSASSMWFAHFRRRGRMIAGGCPACGYDLSGMPGAVCPECGGEAGK